MGKSAFFELYCSRSPSNYDALLPNCDETLNKVLATEKWCQIALIISFVRGNFLLALTCQSIKGFVLTKTFCFAISHRAMNFVLLKAVIMQKHG